MLEYLQRQHLQPQWSVKPSFPVKSDRLCSGRGIHFHQLTPSPLSWEANGAGQALESCPLSRKERCFSPVGSSPLLLGGRHGGHAVAAAKLRQILSSMSYLILLYFLNVTVWFYFCRKIQPYPHIHPCLVVIQFIWLLLTLPWFSSVQSLSHVQLFATPWTAACQASLSITNSRSPPKPMSIDYFHFLCEQKNRGRHSFQMAGCKKTWKW